MIHEITCASAIHKLNSNRLPYSYDVNIYRGCTHDCKYCFAKDHHRYVDGDFARDIYVKTNIASILHKELSNPKWHRGVVNFGGVCDSYQPLEKKYEIMKNILDVLILHQTPCIISTKSDLILRDFDKLKKLADMTYVNIASSIITLDEEMAKILEPGASSIQQRLSVLKAFSNTNASTGMHIMPIIPFVNDNPRDLEKLFQMAKDVKVNYVIVSTMGYRKAIRKDMDQLIKDHYPNAYPKYYRFYHDSSFKEEYKKRFYAWIHLILKKYDLNTNYMSHMKEKLKKDYEQISLF